MATLSPPPLPTPFASESGVDYCQLSPAEQETLLNLQQSILESVARGQDHLETINSVCGLEEQLLPNAAASVMLLDPTGCRLNVYAAPSLTPESRARLNGRVPGPCAGSCGNVIYRQEPVYVPDTLTDDRWKDLRQLAIDFKIMACWSMPIRSQGGRVVGTFALSSFEHRNPSPFHKKLLEIGASIIGIVLDRNRQDESLRLLHKAFESSSEGIMVTDASRCILSVNRAFTQTTGYSQEEVLGQTPKLLSSGKHDRAFYQQMWEALIHHGHWQGELWNRRKNGEIYPQWSSISVVRDSSGQATNYLAVFSDITERKDAQAQIDFLAHHDLLTELPNRLLLQEKTREAIAKAQRSGRGFALLCLDLDHFKTINDSLGHAVGDALLRAVAKRLAHCLGEDELVSRQGGDEFLMLLADASAADLSRQLEKILGEISRPFPLGTQELVTSASIGVACYPGDGTEVGKLIQRADTAMYHAKEAGRNTYSFFDPSMNANATANLRLRNELGRALERGEFVLHYQPQVCLSTGAVVGAEALVRWQHPELGLLSPVRFIGLAEDTGFIVPLGAWVLQEACRQAVRWNKSGHPGLTMAVNLSAIQFKRGNLQHTVLEALAQSGLPPTQLELELTESILIDDTETVLETLAHLRSEGIRLSVDDFGTGYSSLAYLKRFAVHKLKIDQSFVRNMANDGDDTAIVRAIIQMAQSLGLETIAEGVEDQRLPQLLRDYGCQQAQGYLYAKPLAAEVFAAFLEKSPARP